MNVRGGDIDAEAIVCGAGAAGLSSAALLQRAGVHTLVLERSDQIAASWHSRYEGLRLNTLGWMSTQPGYHVGRRPRHFPSREDWIDYLERYAKHHQLPIQFRTAVERVAAENGQWRVETSAGPLRSRVVVVATGYDRQPKMPEWPR